MTPREEAVAALNRVLANSDIDGEGFMREHGLVAVEPALVGGVATARTVDPGGSRYCPGCDAPRSRERGVLCLVCEATLAVGNAILAQPPP